MPPPLPPRMSAAEIAARAAEKRRTILAFLASGERWTTQEIVQQLLGGCDRMAAARTLRALERGGYVISEKINPVVPTIYGVTAAGLALAGIDDLLPFWRGRVKPAFMNHHLAIQRARIRAESLNWGYWIPTRRLMPPPARAKAGPKVSPAKIPDAVVTSPRGTVVAVEVEINHKYPSTKYQDILGRHIEAIQVGKYQLVHYLDPNNRQATLERLFAALTTLRVRGELVAFTDAYRKRFACFSLAAWPPASSAGD